MTQRPDEVVASDSASEADPASGSASSSSPRGDDHDGNARDPSRETPNERVSERPGVDPDPTVAIGVVTADDPAAGSARSAGPAPAQVGSGPEGDPTVASEPVRTSSDDTVMRDDRAVDGDTPEDADSPGQGPLGGEPYLPLTSPVTPTRVGGLVGLLVGWWLLRGWFGGGDLVMRDLVAVSDPVLDLSNLAGGAGHSWDMVATMVATAAGQVVDMRAFIVWVLFGSFVAMGAGTARLAGTNGSRVAGAVAAMLATWNPWVLSRLHQGTWLAIVAFAVLPWAIVHLRADHRWRLARCALIAGLAGGVGWLVLVPTMVVVGVLTRRVRAMVVGLGVIVSTAVPTVLAAGSFGVDEAGFEAMAASAEGFGGTVLSVLTGAGHWNPAVVPASRDGALVGVLALLMTIAAVWGAGLWRESPRLLHDWRTRNGFVIAAVVGLAGVLVMSTGPGRAVVAGLSEVAPWVVVLRDSTMLLAPWILVVAVGFGHLAWWGSERVKRRARDAGAGRPALVSGLAVIAVGVLVVVGTLPDPIGSRLPDAGDVPASWELAARVINADGVPTSVLVVPGDARQEFDFATGQARVALNLMVSGEVLQDGRWRVRRGALPLVVDDDPDLAGAPEPVPTPAPGETPTPPPTVVVDPEVRDDVELPTTTGPSSLEVAQLTNAWPDELIGRQLAEAGIGWVAVVQPAAFGQAGGGLRTVVQAPEITLVEINHDRLVVADLVRRQWPLVVAAVFAVLALALLVGAGPLRSGRELDPV